MQYKRITGTDGEKRFINDIDDYFKHYGIETYDMDWVEKECVNVTFFFILDEAKQYQKYYPHNLGKLRVSCTALLIPNYKCLCSILDFLLGGIK
ncbi:hypothetical protein [Bacillus thuringiensis]|uniref:hypothetical protein n=1 Tax=Bacillus thuringiensis TaxID=1428 RepID=UPI002E174013